MADNINFIPAAQLPLTEEKEVDVLCVTGGELKRKAAANLGGSGGYIIKVPPEDVTIDEEGQIEITLTESYNNYAPVLAEGGSVLLDMSALPFLAEMGLDWMYAFPLGAAYSAPFRTFTMMVFNAITGEPFTINCPNGTWVPPEE